jgi:outer membrane murein-binding lipoprotein Lpp
VILRAAPALAVGLLLAGCGVEAKYQAAPQVKTFFDAVRDGDGIRFERHVDRPALRGLIRRRLVEAAGPEAARVAGRLTGPAGERTVDRLIAPAAFRIDWKRAGFPMPSGPTTPELAAALRTLGPDRVCLPDGADRDRCALTFARRDGIWRLTAIDPRTVKVSWG